MNSLYLKTILTLASLLTATVCLAETAEEKLIRTPFNSLLATQPIDLVEAQQRARMIDRELSRYGVSYRVGVESKPFIAKKEELRAHYLERKNACNRDFDCLTAAQKKHEESLIKVHSEIGKVEERAKKENEIAQAAALATYRNLLGAVAFFELQKELNEKAPAKGLTLETDLMLTFLTNETYGSWIQKVGGSSWSMLNYGMQYMGATIFARNQKQEFRLAMFGQYLSFKDGRNDQSIEAYRQAILFPSNLNEKEIFGTSRKTVVDDMFNAEKAGSEYRTVCLGMDPTNPITTSKFCFSTLYFNSVRLQ